MCGTVQFYTFSNINLIQTLTRARTEAVIYDFPRSTLPT